MKIMKPHKVVMIVVIIVAAVLTFMPSTTRAHGYSYEYVQPPLYYSYYDRPTYIPYTNYSLYYGSYELYQPRRLHVPRHEPRYRIMRPPYANPYRVYRNPSRHGRRHHRRH
jgi:hypothetical protein